MTDISNLDPRTSKYQQPHNIQGTRPEVEGGDIVADTWKKLGKKMRVLRDQVLLRTDVPRTVSEGGIILTSKESNFYQGLPNVDVPGRETAYKWATVVGVGEGVHCVKVGERVAFPRGLFVRYQELSDKSLVGLIREDYIWAAKPDDGTSP